MRPREFLRAVEEYSYLKYAEPTQIIQEIPDEQFKTMVYTVAELLKTLKTEAIRRGIWDELKTRRIE